ncbi:MAG: heme ABC transporter permease [Gammaproteobacteria bacterium TMED78]|nr:MAG: heme ABC transporter permease [Gammaproteobacteria bacterium TMED78]|tara:strand:+ start:6100 stop:6849 length:750 start_codon:yes stop_codon:yes gene_type:complete
MFNWFYRLGSPPHFYKLNRVIYPWIGLISILLIIIGSIWGLAFAPSDYLQGDGFRMIYVHVPSAYVSMLAYIVLAISAGIGFIWRMKLAHAVAVSAAPFGASFTLLALITGSLWGKPMWGTYWEWGDARLLFELLLFFMFLGYILLHSSFEDPNRGDRVSSILAVVGIINIPIIHYSVEWWNTLHQGPTISKLDAPSITIDMLLPLLVMIFGFTLFFFFLLLFRLQTEILIRSSNTQWVKSLFMDNAND